MRTVRLNKDNKLIVDTGVGEIHPNNVTVVGDIQDSSDYMIKGSDVKILLEMINTDPTFKQMLKISHQSIWEFGSSSVIQILEPGPDAPESVKKLTEEIERIYNRGFWDRLHNKIV